MILVSTFAILMMQAAPAPKAEAPQPVTKATVQAGTKADFDRLDANHDGWVDKAEAERGRDANVAVMQKRRSDQITATFGRLDANKDGSLSRQEFDALYRRIVAVPGLPWLVNNDVNKDGRVSLAEATSQAMATFDRRDTDRNGILSTREAQEPLAPPARTQGR